ncbi:hypothetical protein [Microvirga arsenatis]|uniref:Uncharacterized protein n=1 Tax=Microvirga arsenatis TaxID=2692265 RepID=A0ABW9YUS0_9HYPH|nr:hypothetical protein [Microvirga arsenatis]NBJ13363.1 hypothetical protein [Microvirga arsenatis]NBJ24147.1 hypothetical protein [Microvirga arsenatis]
MSSLLKDQSMSKEEGKRVLRTPAQRLRQYSENSTFGFQPLFIEAADLIEQRERELAAALERLYKACEQRDRAEAEVKRLRSEGWVLVPKEPTEAMLSAALLDGYDDPFDEASQIGHRWVREAIWEAMLDAASVSDGSREAGETTGLDPKDDSAVTEGQTSVSNPSLQEGDRG